MKRNQIFREAGVLFIAAFVIISASAVMAETLDKKGEDCFALSDQKYTNAVDRISDNNPKSTNQDLLWDNGDPDGRNGLSSIYWPSYPLVREVVDDFDVEGTWTITEANFRMVTFDGLGPDVIDAVKIFIYEDDGNIPSVGRYEERDATFEGTLTGETYFDRPEITVDCSFDPIELGTGKWWICFQPELEDNAFWLTAVGSGETVWYYSEGEWPKWTDGYTAFGDYYDESFKLYGEAGAAPDLEIESISGGFGVSAVITNNGDADATDVEWGITLEGGLIIIGGEKTGTIDTIAAGESTTVKTGLVFGIGNVNITTTATCAEGDDAEEIASGFVLLFFVLGVE